MLGTPKCTMPTAGIFDTSLWFVTFTSECRTIANISHIIVLTLAAISGFKTLLNTFTAESTKAGALIKCISLSRPLKPLCNHKELGKTVSTCEQIYGPKTVHSINCSVFVIFFSISKKVLRDLRSKLSCRFRLPAILVMMMMMMMMINFQNHNSASCLVWVWNLDSWH
jgi:hypothetical protein